MGSIPIFDISFALLFAHSLVLVLDSLREKTLASLELRGCYLLVAVASQRPEHSCIKAR